MLKTLGIDFRPTGTVPAGDGAWTFGRATFRWVPAALLLFFLALAAYSPVLPGNFIMDDHRLVESDNPLVTGEFTPRNIWFQTDFTLSTLGFWLERLAWGGHPAGYHAVNILLHGLSAVLLWRVLRRLKIPGAWLAGALFALHPVAVNSVARIAELKNTLSLPFFLLSLWAYLQYEAVALYRNPQARPPRSWAGLFWYQLAFVAFLLALLAKTSTVVLPALLLALALWQRRRLTRLDCWHSLPLFALAVTFGLMSVWFQKHQALADAGQVLAPVGFATRLAIAGRVYWFYLAKALLPLNLNLVYPVWKTDASTLAAWLPLLLAGAGAAVCWRFRQDWGRHGLLLLAGFGICLFPSLGLFDAQFLTRWQVSDHLQYLPLIIPVSAVAAAAAAWSGKKLFPGVAVVLLAAGFLLTMERANVFATEEALMRDTLAKNPAAADAHNDLGSILAQRQNFSAAVDEFNAAFAENPEDPNIRLNLGQAMAMQGRLAAAAEHYQAALQFRPGDALTHLKYGQILMQQGKIRPAILQLQAGIIFQKRGRPAADTRIQLAALYYQTGHYRHAAAQLRLAIQTETNSVDALNNLAWILATCPNHRLRSGPEAVTAAERACELTGFQSATPVSTLAAAYAEAGRFPEAVNTANRALQLQNATGNFQQAAVNQQLLAFYQAGRPFHENGADDADPD